MSRRIGNRGIRPVDDAGQLRGIARREYVFGSEIVVAEGPPLRLERCWTREKHFKASLLGARQMCGHASDQLMGLGQAGTERVLIVWDETLHGCGGYGMNAGHELRQWFGESQRIERRLVEE